MILLILWYFDYIFPHGLVNAYVIFKQIKVFWFFWFFLIFSVHLIQAETGNRIMAMCVHCDKLLAISVSLTLTINDERYIDNFQIIQKFKNSKKIKEFDYFDCFDYLIIWIIYEVVNTSYLNEGQCSTDNDFWTFFIMYTDC